MRRAISKKGWFILVITLLVVLGITGWFFFDPTVQESYDFGDWTQSAQLQGTVEVPADFASENLEVQTIVTTTSISADRTFQTMGVNARQLAYLNDHDGNTIFVGFVVPGSEGDISARSTATVMLLYALGGMYLPAESWDPAFEQIQSSNAAGELAQSIQEIVVVDPAYLTNGNGNFALALEQAADDFLPSNAQSYLEWLIPAVHAQGAFTLDTEAKSGVRIDPGFYNEVTFVNQYRRPVRMLIYEIGYTKDGEDTVYDEPKFEQYVDLASVTKLADLASTVVELMVGKVHYGERKSDPITLIPDVSDADVTFYRVYGLGWGAGVVQFNASGEFLDEILGHSEEIQLITGIQEVLLPVFTWVVSFKDIEEAFGYGGQALVKEVLKWFTSTDGARAVLPPLQKGDLLTASRNMFEFLAKSPSIRDEISNFLISGIAKDNPNLPIGEYVDKSAKVFAAPLKYVDLVMKYFDGTVLTAHYLAASRGEEWTIAVRPPSVSLDPATADLQAPANGFFKIVVQDATESMKFETEWSHENQGLGTFVGPATDPHRYTSEFPVGVYQANHDGVEGSDTISAKVFLIGPDGNRKELGTATAEVTVKQEETCGEGRMDLPPEYKLTYVVFNEADKDIFFSEAGNNVHEAQEIIPPPSEEFSLITGASYSENVEFYRDVVDNGTAYDFKTEPKECDPVNTWDCFNVIPVKFYRYLVTVPKSFSLDPELFTAYTNETTTYGQGISNLDPIYENNGNETPGIYYKCKIGRWDGSTRYH